MSLLDHSDSMEPCLVFPEVTHKDPDGNTMTGPAKEGIPAIARFQMFYQSGTSSRRVESDNEGFLTEQLFKIRFDKKSERELGGKIGAQSQIEWRGQRWSLDGDGWPYTGSRRTRRTEYWIVRS